MWEQFDKAFENRMRLQIMSILMVNDVYDFNGLKEILEATDGNLASHLKALEKDQYIEVLKSLVGRNPYNQYRASELARVAFQKHLKALEELIKKQKE